jgi:hypothetical protein
MGNEQLDGEWYLVDGEAKFWDGTRWRRFKWQEPPGVYELDGTEYYWNGESWSNKVPKRRNQQTQGYDQSVYAAAQRSWQAEDNQYRHEGYDQIALTGNDIAARFKRAFKFGFIFGAVFIPFVSGKEETIEALSSFEGIAMYIGFNIMFGVSFVILRLLWPVIKYVLFLGTGK